MNGFFYANRFGCIRGRGCFISRGGLAFSFLGRVLRTVSGFGYIHPVWRCSPGFYVSQGVQPLGFCPHGIDALVCRADLAPAPFYRSIPLKVAPIGISGLYYSHLAGRLDRLRHPDPVAAPNAAGDVVDAFHYRSGLYPAVIDGCAGGAAIVAPADSLLRQCPLPGVEHALYLLEHRRQGPYQYGGHGEYRQAADRSSECADRRDTLQHIFMAGSYH